MQHQELFHPITVSQLSQYLKEKFDGDEALKTICIEGEISNLTLHTSGHIYFTLKDASSAIRAVMFRGYRASLKFIPANGMKVLLIGDVALYERSGTVQLYVQRMMQSGIGEVYYQFEVLKEKLEKEGLFDQAHKKPIPKHPSRICLVTSPTGAALQDMHNVLYRRYPLAQIELCPTTVQGADAASEVVRAIQAADAKQADVILLARGGGSLEDLYVFNDERIARAIYAAKTPIVTGIGHETDFTIADFVADLRAPTPSAAAELAVPHQQDILLDLLQTENRLNTAIAFCLQKAEASLGGAEEFLSQQFTTRITTDQNQLVQQQLLLEHSMASRLQQSVHSLQIRAAQLSANDPLAICAKGYAKLENAQKQAIHSTQRVAIGDTVYIYLPDGKLTTTITDKEQRI